LIAQFFAEHKQCFDRIVGGHVVRFLGGKQEMAEGRDSVESKILCR